ncbi:hypothetical protein [Hymenobacter wooponensis]|uniref:DUF5640 domain-containing protein n=1 Tax=Hymenobacter wooponensis TaxID=1525360 RepID=A0A4Z0MI73_9BACT|nr:hypothetical protein [Hymenobacter wooponensis]TGD79047.1 hypothetical protein EU557_18940 [Hymenobacter wooponensis]
MRFYTTLLLSAFLLILSSCKEDTVAPTTLFGRQWYNTFTPDEKDFFTFRTTSQTIGWRYDAFRMEADGNFIEYGLGPTDAGEERPGTWTETGKYTYQIKFTDPQRQGYTLHVQGVDSETLKARRTY